MWPRSGLTTLGSPGAAAGMGTGRSTHRRGHRKGKLLRMGVAAYKWSLPEDPHSAWAVRVKARGSAFK